MDSGTKPKGITLPIILVSVAALASISGMGMLLYQWHIHNDKSATAPQQTSQQTGSAQQQAQQQQPSGSAAPSSVETPATPAKNPPKAKNHKQSQNSGIHGSDNTQLNDTRPIVGDGNTVMGATDSKGNAIYTTPGAYGKNAHAGPGSIAVGSGAGAGAQQTAIQAPVIQANSGGCNQQVVGGNNNTNNCEGPKLTITDEQFKKIKDAMIPYAGHTVEILIPNQTVESYAYGKRLAEALQAAHLNADPHPLITTSGCDGGVSFASRTAQDFIPVLERAMQSSGAVKDAIKQGGIWIDPADLYITVCPYR